LRAISTKERAVNLYRKLVDALSREAGQGLAEYALILALIAIIAIVALLFLGSQIAGILSNVGTSV
jgi:Flp pilus assembly pilin Flp